MLLVLIGVGVLAVGAVVLLTAQIDRKRSFAVLLLMALGGGLLVLSRASTERLEKVASAQRDLCSSIAIKLGAFAELVESDYFAKSGKNAGTEWSGMTTVLVVATGACMRDADSCDRVMTSSLASSPAFGQGVRDLSNAFKHGDGCPAR